MSVGVTSAMRTPQNKSPTVGGRADGGLLPYTQLFNPRNSMSITNTKGLLNMPGQNNCFLNSAVQVLWHLDIFRRSFRELSGHACMEDSCIFCALKELFAQFQYSQESALPPDALRRALAETFCDQRRFQLGFMDDAAECFENILMRIHFHIANNESEDMCSAIHCIPHQKFAMTLVEQTVCHACGATSEPLPFTQMVHYVPTSALCSQAKLMKEKNEPLPNFSELLKRAGGLGDLRDCPSSCGAVIQIRKSLMNRPEIVSVGLVWDSERPTLEHIMDVFNTIGMSLKLQDVFHSVVDNRWASSAVHQLVGIVTYYGKHYSTFFFHTKLRVWIYFDDAAVREIGPKWEQVVEKCCRGHFQPLLLLYAHPNGIPVNTCTAPRLVTVVPGHKKHLNGKDHCMMNAEKQKHFQHHASSHQRRAVTPNPEISNDINHTLQPRRAVTPSGELTWWDDSTKDHNENTPIKNLQNTYHRLPKALQSSSKSRLAARLSVPTSEKPISIDDIILTEKPEAMDSMDTRAHDSMEHTKASCMDSLESTSSSEAPAYISRQAVENVLQLQKLQRQKSFHLRTTGHHQQQRNSSSSLESLDNVFSLRDKGLPAYLRSDVLDAVNGSRRRDSGNWSGDRNSASSSSTTSLDNSGFFMVGNKRYPNGMRNPGRPGEISSITDAGYDSFSISSSDSYPSAINNPTGKLGQILENVQTAFAPYDISQLQYCLKEIRNNEHFPFGFKDECDKLCAEADIFVAKSIERENVGDISMAALLSDTAAARARAAMDVNCTNTQALAMAKMKHSMCLIRSSNLHKKLKEAETALRRKQKETLLETSHTEQTPNPGNRVTLEGIQKDSSDCTPIDGSKTQLKKCSKKNEDHGNGDKNIEIYATLPKRMLKKKGAISSFVESLTGDESSEEKGNKSDSTCKDDKSPKSPKCKKKHHKSHNKDSDLSDYSSEWEHTKKSALYRTYSGPSANSKTDLSDVSSSSAQTLSDHPLKKQHRIRRKLIGGFMRRKNRSLPDLREGQDSGGETSRSYDDCFYSQTTPVPSRKHPPTSPSPNRQKASLRAHTPPPYKPPPPITSYSCSPSKQNIQHYHPDPETSNPAAKQNIQRFHPGSNSPKPADVAAKQNIQRLRPGPESPEPIHVAAKQNIQRFRQGPDSPKPCDLAAKQNIQSYRSAPEITKSVDVLANSIIQRCHLSPDSINSTEFSTRQKSLAKEMHSKAPDLIPFGNAVWLKELQKKQEEINFRRKQQEFISKSDSKLAVSNQKVENGKELSHNQQLSNAANLRHSTQSLPKTLHQKGITTSCDSHPVRDVPFPPSRMPLEKTSLNKDPTPSINLLCHTLQKTPDHHSQEQQRPSSGANRNFDKTPTTKSPEDKHCSKIPYSMKSTSGSVYTPHLTDAQLTNVLRITTNRSSFRNAAGTDSPEDSSAPKAPPLELRRPDKPPDYETALQRRELLRSDRNYAKLCASGNRLRFDLLLEQAKKRRSSKKCVTFSDKVVLVACAGDEDNDFIPNPLLERVYKQHLMQKPDIKAVSAQKDVLNPRGYQQHMISKSGQESSVSGSQKCKDGSNEIVNRVYKHQHLRQKPNFEASQETFGENVSIPEVDKAQQQEQNMLMSVCNLCHKKNVDSPKSYCSDCTYYMSRFQQSD